MLSGISGAVVLILSIVTGWATDSRALMIGAAVLAFAVIFALLVTRRRSRR